MKEIVQCQVCKKEKNIKDCVPGETIRLSLVSLMRENGIEWHKENFVCKKDLNFYRAKLMESLFDKEKSELSNVEQHVIEHLKDQEIITTELYQKYNQKLTKWDKLSDKLTIMGGSWKFIGFFVGFMFFWMSLNIFLVYYYGKAIDPYPFIFLNLILSCVAAIQAPIIMMSQNRAEERDRLRAESEYQINLKSEIGIRGINEKIDHLIYKQWEKMSEIQQMQLDILEEISQLNKD